MVNSVKTAMQKTFELFYIKSITMLKFMKLKYKYFTLISLCLVFSGIIAQNSQTRPNIIFFLVDDMGWQDTSVPFWDDSTAQNKKFHTHNMACFAATAEKFTNSYANSICTPSRVSLMTGMDAGRHRVTSWTMFKDKAVDAEDSLLSIPAWNVNGLSPVAGDPRSVYATPLPQILKDNWYYTIQCGKAHFGAYQTPGANPLKLGFIKNIGGSASGNPASYLAEDDFGYDPDHLTSGLISRVCKSIGIPIVF